MKRIIITTQVYPPEFHPTAIMVQQLALNLKSFGWDVTVVAGYPHHPYGKVYSGYRKKLRERNIEDGIDVVRSWHLTSESRKISVRAAVYVSQSLANTFGGLSLRKSDLVLVYGPPLSGPPLGWLLAKRQGAKLASVIYDIYPDVAIESGKVKNRMLIKAARLTEKFHYWAADKIVVLSNGFKRRLVSKGLPPEKITVIPVWLDQDEIIPDQRVNPWRIENNIPRDKFVILYAGTIGLISGASIVVDVARELEKIEDILFLFVGHGEEKRRIEKLVEKYKLKNIRFLPFQDRSRLREVQATSDLGLVTLAPGRGKTSVPSKVLGYMAAGRPTIASVDIDSDTADDIKLSSSGMVVPPSDPKALARAILMAYRDPAWCVETGKNARKNFEKKYARDSVLEKYRAVLDSIVRQR